LNAANIISRPRYAIGDAVDLSAAEAQVSKMAKEKHKGKGAGGMSSIFSVKSQASPVKRKAETMEVETNGKDKKTRRGGSGKKFKKSAE
jgi:hypothetical protein